LADNPNPVPRYLRRAIVLWVGAIFVVAGSIACVASIGEWRAALAFERDALEAQGTVVARSIQAASRESNSSTRYLMTFRFTANTGATEDVTEDLPFDDWEALAEGSTLSVRYLPGDPSTARTREPNPWVPPLTVGFTGVFVVLGALLARSGVRRALAILRVQRDGVDAPGTVIEVAPTNMRINRVQQWQARYEFRDREGRRQTGVSELLAPHEAAEWGPNELVVVRYDPRSPQDSYLVGKRRQ
jgi:hypothetical protein